MKCKIDGCEREAMYKKDMVCQKHYFRFMRYGTYDLTSVRKYRITNPAGYQKVYEPEHPLADSCGYVYEHRFVYFNSYKYVKGCLLCGKEISWDTCHIDHIDNDVTNNKIENLRATCMGCNVFRGHTEISMGSLFIEFDGKKLNPDAWSRQDGVFVSGNTIRKRFLSGMSAYESIYGAKKTHTSKDTSKTFIKSDKFRNIEPT